MPSLSYHLGCFPSEMFGVLYITSEERVIHQLFPVSYVMVCSFLKWIFRAHLRNPDIIIPFLVMFISVGIGMKAGMAVGIVLQEGQLDM